MSLRMQFDVFGEPSVLYPFEFEVAPPGHGELLVSNRALGVNPYDWKYVAGRMSSEPPSHPVVPGNEGAGVVTAVGADVTGFAVGDEVLWNVHLGGYATDRVVPVAKVWLKPASVGFEAAASLPVAAGTAFAAIRQLGVGAGDVLLIHGASGGVGSAGVQIARSLGARVIGTASEANHDFVRELGAEPVAYGPGLAERVRAIAGVTAIVDFVGSADAAEASVELMPGLERAVTIAGKSPAHEAGFAFVQRDPGATPAAIALAAEGGLRVEIAERFALADAAKALELSKTGHVRGNIVLVP